LNGTIDPNLTSSKVRFVYATNSSLSPATTVTLTETVETENSSTTQDLVVEGNSPQDFSLPVTGLTSNTTYYYAIEAVPVDGTNVIRGNVVAFIPGGALPQPPTVADAAMTTTTTAAVSTTPTVTVGNSATWDTAATCLVEPASGDCVTLVNTSGRGTWSVDSQGEVTFVADLGFAGGDSITYRGFDNFGQSGSATVTVTVLNTPLAMIEATLPFGTTQMSYGPVTLVATGGTGSYTTWAVTSGALPSGLLLNASTGIISGTPTSVGSSTFTVQVTDSDGATATRDFTIAVADPVSITTSSVPSGVEGTAYPSQTLAASGGSGVYSSWSVTSGALPTGLSLSAASGVISGTPTSVGSSTFTVQVSDNQGRTATRQFTIDVSGPLAITTASPLLTAIDEVAYTTTLTAGGGTAPYSSWRVSSGSLPTGLTLNSATGVIAGTPTTEGSSTFEISVDDAANPQSTATKTFTLVVQGQASVETLGADVVPGGKIRMKGRVNPKGTGTNTYFEFSSDNFSTVVESVKVVESGSSTVDVQIDVSGLEIDTEYSYRMKASNNRGNRTGSAGTFRTPARPVAAIGASDILIVTETTARVRGNVNSKRGIGPARIQWTPKISPASFLMSTSTSTGIAPRTLVIANTDGCESDTTVDGDADETLTCDITGLQPATTYEVTVSIDNGFETDTATHEFTTLAPANPPLDITTSSPLASVEVGTMYSLTFTASGGSGSYTNWSIVGGSHVMADRHHVGVHRAAHPNAQFHPGAVVS
jgi:hypothetical protein